MMTADRDVAAPIRRPATGSTVVARTGPPRGLPAVAAPAAVTVLTAAGAVQTHREPLVAVALCALVCLTTALLLRTEATSWPLVVGLALVAAAVTAACWGDPRNVGWFAMCAIAGWAALALPPPRAAAVVAALVAVFVVMPAVLGLEPGWVTWTFGVVSTGGAFAFVRRQRELVERLRAAQSQLAEGARTDERHRIAREMHDLVGHRLTVALLHLGSARLALDDDPAAARAALVAAESAARDGLDDVRTAVGLLRGSGPAPAPTPGVDAVPELVDSYRDAGAAIALEVRGTTQELAAGPSLTAYRVVQESLTNAVRHGDGGRIDVRIRAECGRIAITVRNGSRPRGRRAAGSGIAAMTERVLALGGTVTAGPAADGWRVEAVIPA